MNTTAQRIPQKLQKSALLDGSRIAAIGGITSEFSAGWRGRLVMR